MPLKRVSSLQLSLFSSPQLFIASCGFPELWNRPNPFPDHML